MRLYHRLFGRHARLVLISFALTSPLLVWAAYQSIRTNQNAVADWLPADYVETGNLRWFRSHFVGDQFVVVSWDGCRLGGDPRVENSGGDDPRMERVAQALVPAPHRNGPSPDDSVLTPDESDSSGTRYFKAVITARQLLDQMTRPPLSLRYQVALERLKGTLIGPDGRQTCLIVTLSDQAIGNFRHVLGRGSADGLKLRHAEGVLFQKLRDSGVDPQVARVGGPPVDNVAIDEEGERTLLRLAGLAGLAGFVLAWGSLRSFRLTAVVFFCGLLSATASLGIVYATGETTDAILLSMPALVYVLAMSGAIHLINYYRDAVEESGLEGAAERALAHGWKPALLCSTTTAFGLLSLCVSELTPIRKFGFYSAIGVMAMLVVLFVFLPAALQVMAPTSRRLHALSSEPIDPRPPATGKPMSLADSIARWIVGRHGRVTAACVVLLLAVGAGIGRVQTNVDLMKLFSPKARILQDYKWFEANLGRLVPTEIVLRFDDRTLKRNDSTAGDQQRYSLLERIEIVSEVQESLAKTFGPSGQDSIGPTVSAATYVPPLPKYRDGVSGFVRRTAMNLNLQQSYDQLLTTGYLRVDSANGNELWRISVRVSAFKDVDYGRFAHELQSVVDPILVRHNRLYGDRLSGEQDAGSARDVLDDPVSGISAVYTGVVPIVYKAQRALLDSLVESTFWSFLTITPLLMVVARGVRSGIVAMLPNVLPVVLVFGGMGWLNRPIDIGSMMSASIALGVAVDDTIHYLAWFRVGLDRSNDRRTAILFAYQRCAKPTLQAALINGVGLSVFAFSTFMPTRQFGFLMLTILLAGAVAELVLLPALLAGPLGKVFEPTSGTKTPQPVPLQPPNLGPGGVITKRM